MKQDLQLQPKGQRILVVDDEEAVAITLQAGLVKLPNCDVTTATSGQQALALCEQQSFDLVFTDYKMTDMDGLTLAAQIKQAHPQTTIIMITAYSHDLLSAQMTDIVVQRVLNKPVGLSQIRRIALEVLDKTNGVHLPCSS